MAQSSSSRRTDSVDVALTQKFWVRWNDEFQYQFTVLMLYFIMYVLLPPVAMAWLLIKRLILLVEKPDRLQRELEEKLFLDPVDFTVVLMRGTVRQERVRPQIRGLTC